MFTQLKYDLFVKLANWEENYGNDIIFKSTKTQLCVSPFVHKFYVPSAPLKLGP